MELLARLLLLLIPFLPRVIGGQLFTLEAARACAEAAITTTSHKHRQVGRGSSPARDPTYPARGVSCRQHRRLKRASRGLRPHSSQTLLVFCASRLSHNGATGAASTGRSLHMAIVQPGVQWAQGLMGCVSITPHNRGSCGMGRVDCGLWTVDCAS